MAEPQRPPFYERDSLTVQTYDVRSDPAGTPVEGDVPFFTRAARESGGPLDPRAL